MYLWPGLPQLFHRGNGSALAVALGLASAAEFGVGRHFRLHRVPKRSARCGVWWVLGVTWLAFVAASLRWNATPMGQEIIAAGEDTFPTALDYYLKGNWFQAERLFREQLQREPRDLESRLTLGTLLRHTRRYAEARRELELLQRLEGAGKWAWEIQRERDLLAQAMQEDGQNEGKPLEDQNAAAAKDAAAA